MEVIDSERVGKLTVCGYMWAALLLVCRLHRVDPVHG